jgi:hypothetical protein
MSFVRHPDFRLQHRTIGRENQPLLVIDNVVTNAELLVEMTAGKLFGANASYFPGVRAKVPLTFQRFLLDTLGSEISPVFGVNQSTLRFTACHFSLVTTPPQKLTYQQRIPHIDSINGNELAMMFYLFKAPLGGTAFYRQRSTGFEYVDQARMSEYWRSVEQEQVEVEQTESRYITGDTKFYEQIANEEGLFNRLLVYRRTSLHSGSIAPGIELSSDPRRGRLSINGFIA